MQSALHTPERKRFRKPGRISSIDKAEHGIARRLGQPADISLLDESFVKVSGSAFFVAFAIDDDV